MTDPFVAEIRIFAGNYAPRGWAFCNGQLLPIPQNTALFALLGTTYGGNGQTNFALPNLQGRVPLHPGQGPGLNPYNLGQQGGQATVTLLTSQIPAHSHQPRASGASANSGNPASRALAAANQNIYGPLPSLSVPMAAQAVAIAGGSQPHNNLQPYLVVNFIIALQGIFPPRP
jgi:microcystin-dependent protein